MPELYLVIGQAGVLLDQDGWHTANHLKVPANIRSPELSRIAL